MVKVKIKKIEGCTDAIIPSYAHHGDAGLDLYSRTTVSLLPGERASVGTGICIELPEGFVGLVWDKSGLSHTHGLKTVGGVIDATYRGEVMVGIMNLSQGPYCIEKGHKIAQLLIQKIENADIEIIDDLSDTSRGESGFGSSGK